jgi:hypothetical protein
LTPRLRITRSMAFTSSAHDGKDREQNARNQPCDSCQCYLFMF